MPRRRTERTKPTKDRRVTLAGRKLRKQLNRTSPPTKIATFAGRAGVDRVAVHRLMNGERWRHIDVNFALAVRDASFGAIAIEDFAAITAVPVDEFDDEEPARQRTGTDDG